MKAMLIRPGDGAATLDIADIAEPSLGRQDIRLSVRAVSVNRADLLIRAGTHVPSTPAAGSPVAGLDAAGEILEVGAAVDGVEPGDRVMAMVPGGLAEQVVIPAALAIPIPPTWSYVEGAAAVLGLMTEDNAIATAGRLRAGESVLVHAAASGVGSQAIQVARQLGAGRILGTTRSDRDASPPAAARPGRADLHRSPGFRRTRPGTHRRRRRGRHRRPRRRPLPARHAGHGRAGPQAPGDRRHDVPDEDPGGEGRRRRRAAFRHRSRRGR